VFQQIVNVTPGSTVPITVGCGGSGGDPFTIPRRRLNVKPRAAVGEDGDNGEATVFNNQYSAAGGQGGQGGNLRSDAAGGAAGGGGSAGGSGSDKYYQSTRGGAGVTTGIGVAAGGGTGGFDWDLAQGVTNNNFTNRYNRTTIDAMLTPVAGGGGSATVNGAIFYGPEAGKNGRKINRRPPPGPGNPGSNSIGGGGGGGGGGKNNRTVPPQSGGDGGCGSCHIYWGRDERGVVIT
jgi:hypothetical protein